ncbi:MAG TPA: nuclear transport factor 2 family protein [Flavisolibacter sp.]|nr:nuclear transport factor 2 family protein [Flavisolibacter sp.]
MTLQHEDLIKNAYAAFNSRDIDTVLTMLHPDVHWANGWEGGYVAGHEELRNYWIRQWKEVNPNVEPTAIKKTQDGKIEVEVHQVVKDMEGNLLMDGRVKHIYTMEGDFIKNMKIEKP